MDKQISSGAVAAIVVVLVVVLGLIAYRVFGTHGVSQEQQQNAQQGIRQDYMRRMQGGQPPVGVPPGPR